MAMRVSLGVAFKGLKGSTRDFDQGEGSRLAELMIELGVAVATDATYTLKRIDNDFLSRFSCLLPVPGPRPCFDSILLAVGSHADFPTITIPNQYP